MSGNTDSPDNDADLPDPDDPDVKSVVDRFGPLADVETAQRVVAATRREDTEPAEETCDLCGRSEPTNLGILVVNNRAYPASPLCDDCYIPAEDLGLPSDVDREEILAMHEQMCESQENPT